MNRSILKLILSLGLINLVIELVLAKTTSDRSTNIRMLKIKKFLKKIKDYRRTRILVSVLILIFSNLNTKNYFTNKPEIKPIKFDFIEPESSIHWKSMNILTLLAAKKFRIWEDEYKD